MRTRSTYYRRGTVLWHGTNAREGFRDLRGPAWVSDSRAVARWFATSYTNRPGEVPRLTKYVVDVPFSLPTFDARGYPPTVPGGPDFADWIERLTGRESGLNSPYEIAEALCDAGHLGWRIVENYAPGDDIMLCSPERFLRRVSTRGAWRP